MAGPWLVDGNRFATKIKSASGASNLERVEWKSDPCKTCPNCHHVIDNSDVVQEWPGLPRGVKFDPSDQEIIWHLLAKVSDGGIKPHPFIKEFIPTVDNDDGICYTHPQNLPGVKQDGSISHFFHRAIKAYNTGTRKRRKIQGDNFGDVRWHKTGRTKPVILDGIQKGCKKIMVLYMSTVRGGKAEKTNWVMHQYHLGTSEDERDGEYVVSKIFYQQQANKGEKPEEDLSEIVDDVVAKVDPVTPKSVTPDPPRAERRCQDFEMGQESTNICTDPCAQQPGIECLEEEVNLLQKNLSYVDQLETENNVNHMVGDNDNCAGEERKWWDSESQQLLDSQQLVEGLSLCAEFLQSQSPDRGGHGTEANGKTGLSDYALLGPEYLKKDLEECQNLELDQANIELDTPPEFRLSQLDSFTAWG
ncbi:SUPPRESSOR OF GAMMA RESPONSE 1 isoform X2 [Populus trichocarpa]|uniref:SUPPRESSOR OF GAMMA RESPONSE 1 isoform X2 n=1 Tax=Populus trichocarpa TaxID=3694 RepID=UPI000CCCD8D8|nr:SUPPRESSOR OF GAMMA RESPONSE 1 isoform X2 [Populus trichocarpa]|eukprot:XP_024465031.1 SUPPRESSOR OF GAMMA RESPONSE 1 isoform X2 [Populus trichocarpa]